MTPSGWPRLAPHWSEAEITRDVSIARERFRTRRLEETRDNYLSAHASMVGTCRYVIENLPRLFGKPVNERFLASLFGARDMQMALRYLCAPPISADDLATLVGERVSSAAVRRNSDLASRTVDVIRTFIDPIRFPWIAEGRQPTVSEIDQAVQATSVFAASQRVQADRRTDDARDLEALVRTTLKDLGMRPVPGVIEVSTSDDMLKRGQFVMSPCNFAGHQADVLLRLPDGRYLALECKDSNSELNSRKRINKEAASGAKAWLAAFGNHVVIPAVVLTGVYNPKYLKNAQDIPLAIFWAHRLQDLSDLVQASGPGGRVVSRTVRVAAEAEVPICASRRRTGQADEAQQGALWFR